MTYLKVAEKLHNVRASNCLYKNKKKEKKKLLEITKHNTQNQKKNKTNKIFQ